MATRSALVIAGAAAIAIAAWLGASGANGSNPFAPASLLIVVPSYLVAESLGDERIAWLLIPLLPALSYLAFSNQLFRDATTIPVRGWVLVAILSLGSVAWFVAAWSYGVKYQGTSFTLSVLGLNLAAAVAVVAAGFTNRSSPKWASSFVFHTVLFAWIGWLSFPWLGEMP